MKSNYKAIGNYVNEVKARNSDFSATELMGVNIDKYFMPSVANIIGTDMSVYKIVRKGQFACNRMHVGRDSRLPVALSRREKPFMVSPAYDVFEIRDTNILDPDYLMMWFSRKEFDRNACFYTDADVRGGMPWKALLEMELPVPSIQKQREIIAEYNTIQNRINLNNQLIQKLEETAQTLYKHWFVDFEFPDINGKPYKSSGGEMVESEKGTIPCGWKIDSLEGISSQIMGFPFESDFYSFDNGISVLRGENVSERYIRWDNHKKWNLQIKPRIQNCFLKANDIVIGMDGSKVGKNWAMISKFDLPLLLAQRVSCIRAKASEFQNFIFLSMSFGNFENYVSQVQTGTSIPHISGQQIFDFKIVKPEHSIIKNFDTRISPLFEYINVLNSIEKQLHEIRKLLLSKLATIE